MRARPTSDHQVVLARQFRPGPNAVLDELPGGGVDEGEDTDLAILRELLEETGYLPSKLVPLGIFLEDAYSTIERHGYLALGCEQKAQQKLDQNEFIEVVLKPLPDFLVQLRAGLSTDAEVAWAGLVEAGILKLPS